MTEKQLLPFAMAVMVINPTEKTALQELADAITQELKDTVPETREMNKEDIDVLLLKAKAIELYTLTVHAKKNTKQGSLLNLMGMGIGIGASVLLAHHAALNSILASLAVGGSAIALIKIHKGNKQLRQAVYTTGEKIIEQAYGLIINNQEIAEEIRVAAEKDLVMFHEMFSASQTLLRATTEPDTQKQTGELLRPAQGGTETAPQELLRASNEKKKDELKPEAQETDWQKRMEAQKTEEQKNTLGGNGL